MGRVGSTSNRTRILAGVVLAALAVAACGGGDDESTTVRRTTTTAETTTSTAEATSTSSSTSSTTAAAPTTTTAARPATTSRPAATAAPGTTAAPVPAPSSVPAGLRLKLTEVARLEQPLDLVAKPGSARLYVAEKTGRVKVLRDGKADVVLDLSGQVSKGNEQGLLGIVFSPDGRYLYVDFTDTAGDTHVEEFATNGDGIDQGSRRVVLQVDQPAANHNGGRLVFGPDGKLWISLGDGGGAGDQYNNAQNLATLLGALLRIDPRPGNAGAYGIPADNPFVGRAGARGELAVIGLRNPWRFSFDRATGDLWIGDVGQGQWEEVDHLASGRILGANMGWPYLEGTHAYKGTAPAGLTGPVYEYSHDDGQSIAGGFVYRGAGIAELRGAYLFADTYAGDLWALTTSGRRTFLAVPGGQVAGFGEDTAGEIYVLSLAGAVLRIDRG
jgi:glucose/arabinose dehydrogenase